MRWAKESPWPWLLAWTLLNLVQAGFTELFHDEAHYWMFSQHLAWGYWDHPPATPFLVWLGASVFPGELGVRFFIVLASTATVWFLYKLVRPKNLPLFFSLLFSMLLIHIGGFMAAPDITLVFFAAAFLPVLRSYLETDSVKTAILLAVLTAGLAYSKYHGAIFLLFLFLPNWKLVKRKSFWLVPVLALVLFLPHLYWQYAHDFPTFRYHLIDRGAEAYEWRFLGDYLGGQLLVFGPLVAIPVLIAGFRRMPEDAFERSLKWCMIGVLGFFLYRGFQERTEANWTATALLPAVYLSYHFIKSRPSWKKWIYGLSIPSIVLILLVRLYFMWDFLPEGTNPRNEFHNWDVWAEDISAKADSLPVIFYNSYRGPSKYQFYSGKKAYTVNNWSHSGNQYDLLWEEEEALQGKRVMRVSEYLSDGTPFSPGGIQDSKYGYTDDFRSYNRLKIKILNPVDSLYTDDRVPMEILLINPTDKAVDFSESSREIKVYSHVYEGDRVEKAVPAMKEALNMVLEPGDTLKFQADLFVPEKPGHFRYRFAIHVGNLHNGRQANFQELVVLPPN
ncbi:MAG: glycosyltransferase family 39 protein [Bacteroidetes bacterium]|nr:glycosyltransferase family 39 protein [Bacteroidota bacterium]